MHNDNFPQNPSPSTPSSRRPSNPSPHNAQKSQDHKTFGNEPEIKDPPNPHQPRQYEVTVSQQKSEESSARKGESQSSKDSEVNQPKGRVSSENPEPPSKSTP